jgi:hypothetical protein
MSSYCATIRAASMSVWSSKRGGESRNRIMACRHSMVTSQLGRRRRRADHLAALFGWELLEFFPSASNGAPVGEFHQVDVDGLSVGQSE